MSEPGSRTVERPLDVVRYSHVMHLVSLVSGRSRADLDALHAYVATMNMGTLVGAPKLEAAKLLRRYEPSRRGPYDRARLGDRHPCRSMPAHFRTHLHLGGPIALKISASEVHARCRLPKRLPRSRRRRWWTQIMDALRQHGHFEWSALSLSLASVVLAACGSDCPPPCNPPPFNATNWCKSKLTCSARDMAGDVTTFTGSLARSSTAEIPIAEFFDKLGAQRDLHIRYTPENYIVGGPYAGLHPALTVVAIDGVLAGFRSDLESGPMSGVFSWEVFPKNPTVLEVRFDDGQKRKQSVQS